VTAAPFFVPTDNPFSARNTRPGALAYRFPPGQCADTLVQRLQQHGWRGQIVGPHGSGKSTLLASLLPLIERAGKPTLLVTLHDGQRRLPPPLQQTTGIVPGTLVVVDGYEQLSWLSRLRLGWLCRRRDLGLLVTTHRNAGLPDLIHTLADVHLAQSLVAQLLGSHSGLIAPDEVVERFTSHRGNLRELLFELYDLYEQRRPQHIDQCQ
jgi:energy-coupling factor transporter ATP-binding protein EcfA2